jgi:predicted alpha/beta hydrolase family esterase
MPDEVNSPYPAWKAEIESRLASLSGPVALVGHSVGGSVLLRWLCDSQAARNVAGLFVVAAPFRGADEFWRCDELTLPPEAAAKLAGDWPLFFYHSRDDDVVPFAHLALHAAAFPRAAIRALDGRGHQLCNDLTEVAADIRQDRH